MTHRIIYRKTELHVELWPGGNFRRAYVGPEIDITNLLLEPQKQDLSILAKEKIARDDYGPELGGDN